MQKIGKKWHGPHVERKDCPHRKNTPIGDTPPPHMDFLFMLHPLVSAYMIMISTHYHSGYGILSDFANLVSGMPQGSVLGPMKFCLYLLPLCAILKNTILAIIFMRTTHNSISRLIVKKL